MGVVCTHKWVIDSQQWFQNTKSVYGIYFFCVHVGGMTIYDSYIHLTVGQILNPHVAVAILLSLWFQWWWWPWKDIFLFDNITLAKNISTLFGVSFPIAAGHLRK